ncbi:hypothetical protein EVAR_44391_1 [Eumeta japonica]|uniref:Uncharacterized protein n=1 Tax=Eumeta variegata TaxID=151549 RepID=A0A4C1XP88_EUMVA|nr:hypothetical protein EVAR_44391_1 [Eumeta japonica]
MADDNVVGACIIRRRTIKGQYNTAACGGQTAGRGPTARGGSGLYLLRGPVARDGAPNVCVCVLCHYLTVFIMQYLKKILMKIIRSGRKRGPWRAPVHSHTPGRVLSNTKYIFVSLTVGQFDFTDPCSANALGSKVTYTYVYLFGCNPTRTKTVMIAPTFKARSTSPGNHNRNGRKNGSVIKAVITPSRRGARGRGSGSVCPPAGERRRRARSSFPQSRHVANRDMISEHDADAAATRGAAGAPRGRRGRGLRRAVFARKTTIDYRLYRRIVVSRILETTIRLR